MLRISWTKYLKYDEELDKTETKGTIILTFLGHMKKAGLENWTLTGHFEHKKDWGKPSLTYLKESLSKHGLGEVAKRQHLLELESTWNCEESWSFNSWSHTADRRIKRRGNVLGNGTFRCNPFGVAVSV